MGFFVFNYLIFLPSISLSDRLICHLYVSFSVKNLAELNVLTVYHYRDDLIQKKPQPLSTPPHFHCNSYSSERC